MIKSEEFDIVVLQLFVTPNEVMSYMNGNKCELPELFVDIVHKQLKSIANYKVQIGYQVFLAKINNNELNINNVVFNVANEVSLLLNGIEKVAVFACTIGNELSNKFHEYIDPSEAYVIDIIGNLIIEKSSEYLLQHIQNDLTKDSLKSTNIISPGNCGWPFSDQEKLFKLLPQNYLGITLNNYGMMNPTKSLSGIMGIGKNVKFTHSNCNLCSSKNCLYRKNIKINNESKK